MFIKEVEKWRKEFSIPQNKLDEIIELLVNLYGKYDKLILVNNDLTNGFQFPMLNREVYTK